MCFSSIHMSGNMEGSTPMVLEQSNDEDDDSGVDESEIQRSIYSFEMSQPYQHCLQVHRWIIRAHIHLAGNKKYDVNANFYSWKSQNWNCKINQLPVENLKIQL